MLHRLAELDGLVREAYAEFDYKRIFAALNKFMTPICRRSISTSARTRSIAILSSTTRKACLTVLDRLFRCTVTWLAPLLCFTAEESWTARYGEAAKSVHLELFPEVPADWRDEDWPTNGARCASCAASSPARSRSSGRKSASAPRSRRTRLCTSPIAELYEAVVDIDLAEVCITSAATLVEGEGPANAFRLPDVSGVAVVPNLAEGTKCARSWKILTDNRRRSRIPRRLPARRQGPARMGNHAQGGGVKMNPLPSWERVVPSEARNSGEGSQLDPSPGSPPALTLILSGPLTRLRPCGRSDCVPLSIRLSKLYLFVRPSI